LTDPTDPGWRRTWVAIVPVYGFIAGFRRGSTLLGARTWWVLVAFDVTYLIRVVVLLTDTEYRTPAGGWVAGTVAFGVWALVGPAILERGARTRPATDRGIGAFNLTVIRIAFAAMPALVGLQGSLATESATPYLVALPFTAIGLALACPTARRWEVLAGGSTFGSSSP
jgi:hypothetical protein